MTGTVRRPGRKSPHPRVRASELEPVRYSRAPVIAAGMVAGGAMILVGWCLAQVAADGNDPSHKGDGTSVVAPADPYDGPDGTGTVRVMPSVPVGDGHGRAGGEQTAE